jgi:alkanesulfonate monooxygenase SsuD/methylene tetrahydromethanopterin reductase-like flavin-dependent oxidoreductase (luciferase family)
MTRNNGRKLAVGVVPMETRRGVIVRLARRAEELGYDAFTVAEGWGHDATAVLAEIAVHTNRIQIGSGVLNVWGRSAATIAMSATSLADISGGRYVLGLGAGSPALAEGWHGVPFEDPVGRLRTVTQQVRRLLDGERLDTAVGSAVPSLRLAAPAAARIPIGVAALGPKAVRLAGEVADAWMPFFLPRAALPTAVQQIKEAAASSVNLSSGAAGDLARSPRRGVAGQQTSRVHRQLVDHLLPHPDGPAVPADAATIRVRRRRRRPQRGAREPALEGRSPPDRRAHPVRFAGTGPGLTRRLVRRRSGHALPGAAARP